MACLASAGIAIAREFSVKEVTFASIWCGVTAVWLATAASMVLGESAPDLARAAVDAGFVPWTAIVATLYGFATIGWLRISRAP
jgi:hypothetical protein